MIPIHIIDEIKEKSDIVAIISEYIALKKRGKNYLGLCPFHSEKTPSFTVSPDKKIFHCFGCGEGGNIFTFLMKTENFGFSDAVRFLGDKIGVAVPLPTGPKKDESGLNKLFEILKLSSQFFQKNLADSPPSSPVKEYLKKRDISEETIATFKLGYSQDSWDGLLKYLIQRGAHPKDIENCGLVISKETGGQYDRFRSRLMFPICDHRGRELGFSARIITDGEPKYINSPETPLHHKSKILYGLSLSKDFIRREKYAIIVEGQMDVITSFMGGIKNVVASMGTALTQDQCRLLSRYCNNVVLAYDADLAGNAATERGIEILKNSGFTVRIAELNHGKDPDELIKLGGASLLKKTIENSVSWLKFKINQTLNRHNLNDIESKAKAIRETTALISKEPDRLIRAEYIKYIAQKLKMSLEAITAEVKREAYYKGRTKAGSKSRITSKPQHKIIKAEEAVLQLAIENEESRIILKEKLHWAEFTAGVTREIAEMLFKSENNQDILSYLFENLTSEQAKRKLSALMMGDEVSIDHKDSIFDYISTIKAHHLKEKLNSIRSELVEAEEKNETEKAKALHKEFQECSCSLRNIERNV